MWLSQFRRNFRQVFSYVVDISWLFSRQLHFWRWFEWHLSREWVACGQVSCYQFRMGDQLRLFLPNAIVQYSVSTRYFHECTRLLEICPSILFVTFLHARNPIAGCIEAVHLSGPSSHVFKLGTSRVTGPPWQIALNRNRRSRAHSRVSLRSNSTSFPPCESGQWKQVRPASTCPLLFDKTGLPWHRTAYIYSRSASLRSRAKVNFLMSVLFWHLQIWSPNCLDHLYVILIYLDSLGLRRCGKQLTLSFLVLPAVFTLSILIRHVLGNLNRMRSDSMTLMIEVLFDFTCANALVEAQTWDLPQPRLLLSWFFFCIYKWRIYPSTSLCLFLHLLLYMNLLSAPSALSILAQQA